MANSGYTNGLRPAQVQRMAEILQAHEVRTRLGVKPEGRFPAEGWFVRRTPTTGLYPKHVVLVKRNVETGRIVREYDLSDLR